MTWGQWGLGPSRWAVVEQGVHLGSLQPQTPLAVPTQGAQAVARVTAGKGGTVGSMQLATRVSAEGGQGSWGQASVHLVAGRLGDGWGAGLLRAPRGVGRGQVPRPTKQLSSQ